MTTAILILDLGNVVFAHGGGSDNNWSFKNMLPRMIEMHPEMNEQVIGANDKGCHGSINENNENVPMKPNPIMDVKFINQSPS